MKRLIVAAILALASIQASAQTRAEIDTVVDSAGASVGDVDVRLFSTPDPTDATMRVPNAEVREKGTVVLSTSNADAIGERPYAAARFAEIDAANATSEIVLTTYSGGAHCCSSVKIATKTAEGWKIVEVGSFDGSGDYVEDADGDGQFEVVTVDNSFLYAFDCYACSYAPLKMFEIKDGVLRDASSDPRFVDRHKSWLEEMRRQAKEQDALSTAGFLAGEVAIRLMAGEGPAAVRDFEKRAKAAKIEPVLNCPNNAADCADDQRKSTPFATAVKEFLKANGYVF
jgi:hypothetical protein